MTSPHRKPLGRGAALTIAWAGMVATLLLVVAFVAWVNARISPPPITPEAVQAVETDSRPASEPLKRRGSRQF